MRILIADRICIGETAKSIFEKAQLPNEVLGRIWNLADREQKGYLGLTEFIIAMHLLASYKNGSMRALPAILPAGLYEAAARRGMPRQITGSRPTSDSAPGSAIPRQFSGPGYQGQAPPRPQQPPFQTGLPTGDQWAITPQDKAKFDQIYATVDTQNRGYITGEQAVTFFSNSGLPEEALAQIWDLADINSEGQLNRDEFAVAMYLIKQQRSKTTGRDILPQSLPPNLIPPSMRRQPIAPQQPTAPVFDNSANISAPKSASEDLFGLDAFSSPEPAPAVAPLQPKTTGDSAYVSTPPRNQTSPAPPQFQQQPSHFKPFQPSSSFGQTIMTPQGTGTSGSASPTTQNRNLPLQQKQPSAMDDLLGDNDPEVSKRLTNETSELANLSNQVSTLGTQMQEVRTKRASTEQNLSQAQAQKRDFEGRLGQLRIAYQNEVKELEALEERLTASRNETKKLQQDMAMIQGTHQELQNQRKQVSEALNADQNENTNLKEKIRQTNAEIAELKPQVEKIRSDARQQKGLVAINKKQLATNEAELEKIKADLEQAAKDHQDAKRDLEQSQRDIEAASQAVAQARSQQATVASPPAAVTSPTPSTASMNPFYRRSSNAAGTERAVTSPYTPQNVTSPNYNAFDSFFGPSAAPSNQASGPLPPVSYRSETPNNMHEGPQPSTNQSQVPFDGASEANPSGSSPPSNFSDSPQITGEPPAPPQSRQITSSFLPFRANLERSGSNSSSTKANPPGSRMGDTPSGFDTPTERRVFSQETTVPESPREHFEELAAKAPQAESSQVTPPSSQQSPFASNEGIQQHEAIIPEVKSHLPEMPSASRELPGAFPGDETPVESESAMSNSGPYSNSKLDPRVDAAPRAPSSNLATEVTSNHDDPFAMAGNGSRSPATSKDDFDSAFADFSSNKGKAPEQANGTMASNGLGSSEVPKSHGEFPPIQEIGADDESDSDDERGFEDSFTAHSANRTIESGPNQVLQDPPVSAEGGLAPTRPPFNTMESNTSELPTPGAQKSPPSYDQTVGSPEASSHRKGSNQFPAEYSGLLPSRDDPTSPANLPPPATTTSSAAGIDRGLNFFGNDASEHAPGHAPIGSSFAQEHSPMSPGASNAAPYAYVQSHPQNQPAHTNPPVPAKNAVQDDFDDEFAGLEEAKEASDQGDVDFASSRRTDFDEFNPVFDSPSASRHTAQSTASTFPPSDSFADFESSFTNAGSSRQQAPQETPSHDWDAMFAGLDSPQNNGVSSELGPRDFSSSIKSPNPTAQPKPAGMPPLNRATTEDTEQDDPILKRLTGMGYPRRESLAALEKYDYNLDKVRSLSFVRAMFLKLSTE